MGVICSFRIYCRECEEDEVIKKKDVNRTDWSVKSFYSHDGICPSCKKTVPEQIDRDDIENVDWTEVDRVGEKTNESLHRNGYRIYEDMKGISPEQILHIPGVGKENAASLIGFSERKL